MNREQIDARIYNHFKHALSPHYKVVNIRTRWTGQKGKTKFFQVRYFVISDKFIGGIRYDMVSVTDKEIKTIIED